MVAKSIFKYDLWHSEAREEDNIYVHCFMPNGNYISFQCPGIMTLSQMKEVCKDQNFRVLLINGNKKRNLQNKISSEKNNDSLVFVQKMYYKSKKK